MDDNDIKSLVTLFEQKETEENWLNLDEGLSRFANSFARSASVGAVAIVGASLRKLKQPIVLALSSERTRLSRTAMTLVEALASNLHEKFEPLADFTVPALLKLCTRANKVYVSCASSTLKAIIEHAGIPNALPLFYDSLRSATKTLRVTAVECIIKLLEVNGGERMEHHIESLEAAIREGVVDSTPEVRDLSRKLFDLYKQLYPNRVDRFVIGLPEVAAKYLKVFRPSQISKRTSTLKAKPTLAPGRERARFDDESSLESETPSFDMETALSCEGGRHPRPKSINDLDSLGASIPFQRSLTGSSMRTLENTPNINAPAAGPPRRIPFEKPARVASTNEGSGFGAVTHLNDHTGGAIRVRKEDHRLLNSFPGGESSARVPQKGKALRVPSQTHNVLVDHGRPTSPSRSRADSAGSASNLVEDLSVPFDRVPVIRIADSKKERPRSVHVVNTSHEIERSYSMPIRQDSIIRQSKAGQDISGDINNIVSKMKSSDWSLRLRAIESAHALVSSSDGWQHSNEKAARILEIYSIGLSDIHAKVLQSSLQGVSVIIERSSNSDILEVCVPRLVGLLYYQTQKAKSNILQLARVAMNSIREKFGIESVCMGAIHALHNPEFAKSLKVRIGCVALFADLTSSDWAALNSRSSNIRSVLTRLFQLASETDAGLQKMLRSIFASINSINPELFWLTWNNIKSSDRQHVNTLFGTRDLSNDKQLLDSLKKNRTPIMFLTSPSEKLASSVRSRVSSGRHSSDKDSVSSSPSKVARGPPSAFAQKPPEHDIDNNVFIEGHTTRNRTNSVSSSDSSAAYGINGISKMAAAYEDSDTDWMTDSEVLRSPDGSECNQDLTEGVYVDNTASEDLIDDVATPRSKSPTLPSHPYNASDTHADGEATPNRAIESSSLEGTVRADKASLRTIVDSILSPKTPRVGQSISKIALTDRVSREVTENMDALKAVDEMLSKINIVERKKASTVQKVVSGFSSIPVIKATPTIGHGSPRHSSRSSNPSPLQMSSLSPSPTNSSLRTPGDPDHPGPAPKPSENVSAHSLVLYTPENVDLESFSPQAKRQRGAGSFSSSPSTPSTLKVAFTVEPQTVEIVASAADGFARNDDDIDLALGSGVIELWRYAQTARGAVILEDRASDILNCTISSLSEVKGNATAVKCGLFLIKMLLEVSSGIVTSSLSDVCCAIMRSDLCSDEASDDKLEIDYEVDTIIDGIELQATGTEIIEALTKVLDVSSVINARICFDMLTRALNKEDGYLATKFGVPESLIQHVVKGLDSPSASTRKAAFDCSVSLCRRNSDVVERLCNEVTRESGLARGMVVKGMLERRLNPST